MRELRVSFRRLRQSALLFLLAVVAAWGYLNWRADNFTFAWTDPVEVMVVAVVDPGADPGGDITRGFLHRFLTTSTPLETNIAGVEEWFASERERITGNGRRLVKLKARGPVQALAPPPLPPADDASFLERWRGTRDFLGYFEDLSRRENLTLKGYDAAVFVYLYGEERAAEYSKQHSIASRRDRIGVVFSPLDPRHFDRCAALLAHELCHAFGASDKYDGERSRYPEGFAEPDLEPPYPQRKAEIMALGIPIAPGRESQVTRLGECAVGSVTAREMSWVR